MCWNEDVSINTFMFACGSLAFIFVTNRFTRYKTPFFDNPFMYLFFLAVANIQFMEFFLWKHLKNKQQNEYFSKLLLFFIVLQPLFLIAMIPELTFRCIMLILYLFYFLVYSYLIKTKCYTSIGKNGHLCWEWMNFKGKYKILILFFLLFYIIPALKINNTLLTLFIIILLCLSLLFYFKYNTFGTMWCWISNSVLFYFLLNILLIQPYLNHSLC